MSAQHITTPADLGSLIRTRRKELGLSQGTLSSITGVPQPNLSKIERGEVVSSLDTYLRLLASLGVDLIGVARV